MSRSKRAADRSRRGLRAWIRRGHRWLGLAGILFVLLLSATGIALNHSNDWRLDQHYLDWDWAIRALGIQVPEPEASFAASGHRATQLGNRVYYDQREVPYLMETLTGLLVLGPLAVVAARDAAVVLTVDGDVVQHIDLTAELPSAVERIGSVDGRAVLDSGGKMFIGDADVTGFASWSDGGAAGVTWSTSSEPSADEVAALQARYRGRVLTIERLMLEIHSGRIVSAAGPLLLDIVAVALILLGLSGLIVWWQRRKRGNGTGERQR